MPLTLILVFFVVVLSPYSLTHNCGANIASDFGHLGTLLYCPVINKGFYFSVVWYLCSVLVAEVVCSELLYLIFFLNIVFLTWVFTILGNGVGT